MRLVRTLVAAALVVALAGPAYAAPPAAPSGPAAVPAAPAAVPAAPTAAPDTSMLDAARAKVAAGDTRGAIAGLAPYVAENPKDIPAGRLLGDLYFRVPDYARAEKTWKAIIAVQPDDRETHNRLGSLYAVLDRIDDSIGEFQKSLPSRAGYAGLVNAHKRAGDLPQFLAKAQEAAERAPFNPALWSDLGQFRRALRQYDLALAAFTRVVGIRPKSCAARVDIANVLVDLHDVDPAIVHLQRCLQNDATYYPAVVNLGEAYLEKNEIVAARPYFDRALAIRADGSEALVDIGYILDLHGDWKGAIAYYTRAIVADPLRPEAYIDLGYDYNEHRLFALAEAAFLKGLSVSSDDGRLHYMLAVAYNLQGKIELARVQYRRAIESQETDVVRAAKNELALLPPQ